MAEYTNNGYEIRRKYKGSSIIYDASNYSSLDTDTETTNFVSKGTYTTTEINAVNELVKRLKASNLWSKMKVIYPMVGGTLTSTSIDLISSNSNTFNIQWQNTANLIVTSQGIKSANTTPYGYGKTSYIPDNNVSRFKQGYTVVVGAIETTNIGFQTIYIGGGWNKVFLGFQNNSTTWNSITGYNPMNKNPSKAVGIWNFFNWNGVMPTFTNGILHNDSAGGSTMNNALDVELFVLNANNGSGGVDLNVNGMQTNCLDRVQSIYFHEHLTNEEKDKLNSIINNFEQSLGRKTW